jgi:hypothetical protein
LTPFEILYGALPPIVVQTLPDQDPSTAPNYLASLKALQEVQREIWPIVRSLYETKDTLNPEHGIVPGDWVWVKRHRAHTLEERRKGPYLVILVTPTALKVDDVGPWVRHSHVRQASQQEQKDAREWTTRRHPDNPLKLKLLRPWEHAESSRAAMDGLAGRSDLAQCPEQEPHRNHPHQPYKRTWILTDRA